MAVCTAALPSPSCYSTSWVVLAHNVCTGGGVTSRADLGNPMPGHLSKHAYNILEGWRVTGICTRSCFFFFEKKIFFFLNLRPNFIYTPGRGLGCRRLLWLFPGPLHPQELQTQPFPAVNLPGHSSWNLRSHSRCLPLPTHLLCPEIPPLPGLLPTLPNSLKDNPNTLSPWLPDCESDCVSPLFKIQQFPLHFKGTDQTPQFKAFRG